MGCLNSKELVDFEQCHVALSVDSKCPAYKKKNLKHVSNRNIFKTSANYKSRPKSVLKGNFDQQYFSMGVGRTKILPVCDDFDDANDSYGYFSDSESIQSPFSSSDSTIVERGTSIGKNYDYDMEMFMMIAQKRIIQNTSSPLSNRKFSSSNSETFLVSNPVPIYTSSKSYTNFKSHVENTPAYTLHNRTDIPEAITGQCSPLHFPSYSYLQTYQLDNNRTFSKYS